MLQFKISLNRRIKRYFAEMLLIIISVLLAFVLNEVRNNYIEKQKRVTSLEFIQEEIKENHLFIVETIEIHKAIWNVLDSIIETKSFESTFSEENGFAYQNFYQGKIFKQALSNDAWGIANNNNILSKMQIDNIMKLSRAYEQQNSVMDAAWEINDFLQSDDVYYKDKVNINCKILRNRFHLLIGLEIRLIKNYKEAEETLLRLI